MELSPGIKDILNLTWQRYAARNLSFLMTYSHLNCYIYGYPKYIKTRFKYVIVEGKGVNWIMYRNTKEQKQVSKKVDQLAIKPSFLKESIRKVEKGLENYKQVSDRIYQTNLKNISNIQLAKLLLKYTRAFPGYTSGVSAIIFIGESAGKYLHALLKKEMTHTEAEKVLGLLSTPIEITIPTREEIDFLRMIAKLQKFSVLINKIETGKWLPILDKHFKKYSWITAYIDDEPWIKDEFLRRVANTLKARNIEDKIKSIKKRIRATEQEIQLTVKNFNLDKDYVNHFRKVIYHRILGETMYGYGNVSTKDLFKEIARRLYLSERQVRYLTPLEVILALKGKLKNIEDLIRERERHYLIIVYKEELNIFEGQKAGQLIRNLKIKTSSQLKMKKEIRGTIAVEGLVRATVKVVKNVNEIHKVEQGEILVTSNTTPSFVPAMKKAAAIVTDEGGVTCHAAIVSRELGIPCVIGTKIATKVLKDGDRVEVDATQGIIRKL